MGIGDRNLSSIKDPVLLKALDILVRAARGMDDPLDARERGRRIADGSVSNDGYFTRYMEGRFPTAQMHNIYTPTRPVRLVSVSAQYWAGSSLYLGILRTGSTNFAELTPKVLPTAPGAPLVGGFVGENDNLIIWNGNFSPSTWPADIYTTRGPGKLIEPGYSLYYMNDTGSTVSIFARFEFRFE